MSANQQARLQTSFKKYGFLYDAETEARLLRAADTFVHYANNSVEIWAASRDWFLEEWGRDAFIALPGLLLSTKRFSEARQVFTRFAGLENEGLIPNRIEPAGTSYNTVDASLWFVAALEKYVHITDDWDFVIGLLPTLHLIVRYYKTGTGYMKNDIWHNIVMDQADGLVVSPPQATWMDADPGGTGTAVVTPRNGKCVEINALWYLTLRFTSEAERQVDSRTDTTEIDALADQVQANFASTFWNDEADCLLDVVGGDPHSGAVRPNQIIAISHGRDLLTLDQKQRVATVVERDLLTPGGLRTLSPRDSHYRGVYDTYAPIPEKDLAYHQGTAWPWLIGPYCDALINIADEKGVFLFDKLRRQLEATLAPLVKFCLDSEYDSLPEVFSGDDPQEPGGTTSQAWSVGEVLRSLLELKKFR